MRVGTLAVNMVKTLMPALQLFSVTKMDLFRFLVEKKFLPKDGLVYLGQKKNVRKFPDRDVASPDRDVALQRLYGNVFLDYVYDEEYWK